MSSNNGPRDLPNGLTRDPSDYTLSIHAKQMMRDRNIGIQEIKSAIRQGEPDGGGAKPTDIRLRLDFPGVDLLAVIDSRDLTITSVFYDDEQGAKEGGL